MRNIGNIGDVKHLTPKQAGELRVQMVEDGRDITELKKFEAVNARANQTIRILPLQNTERYVRGVFTLGDIDDVINEKTYFIIGRFIVPELKPKQSLSDPSLLNSSKEKLISLVEEHVSWDQVSPFCTAVINLVDRDYYLVTYDLQSPMEQKKDYQWVGDEQINPKPSIFQRKVIVSIEDKLRVLLDYWTENDGYDLRKRLLEQIPQTKSLKAGREL